MKTASIFRLRVVRPAFALLCGWGLALLGTGSVGLQAAVPPYLSYQGHLTDSGGNALTGSTYTVYFKLYNAATGGTAVWGEKQSNVVIASGEFGVLIGSGNAISNSIPGIASPATTIKSLADILADTSAAGAGLYLGVTVDSGDGVLVEITPRQQLVSGAFALRAGIAEGLAAGALTASMIADETITSTKLASNAVLSANITDSAVTGAKIAAATITQAKIAAGAVSSDKIDTSTVGLWSVNTTGVYRSTGNIGVGTNNTAFPITLAAADGDKISLYGGTAGAAHFGMGVKTNVLQIHADASTSAVAMGYGTSAAFTPVLYVAGTGSVGVNTTAPAYALDVTGTSRVTGAASIGGALSVTGNVGINKTSPAFPLTFATALGDKIALYASSSTAGSNHYGFGVSTNLLQIHSSTSSTAIGFGYGASDNFTENVRITGDGRVGIGTTSPDVPLDVRGEATVTSYTRVAQVDGSSYSNNNTNTTGPYSISSAGRIRVGGAVDISSDLRIKTDLHPSDGGADLQSLLGIQITNYRHVDVVSAGAVPQKKVIAQQVESVYPQAVTKGKGVVPDIYQMATLQNGWIQLKTDLKVGERVRLIGARGQGVYEVLQVVAGAFRTEFKEAGEVFVYGREVADFRSVDYDAISMLNVSATQALYRQQQADRAENAALRQKVSAMESRLGAVEKLLRASK